MKYEKKEEWWRYGKDFLVVIKHHTHNAPAQLRVEDGGQRWSVCVYVYPDHKYFPDMLDRLSDRVRELPLHGGVSHHMRHYNDGGGVAVQVSSDYNHDTLHDKRFTFIETESDAFEVFNDADELFQYMEKDF